MFLRIPKGGEYLRLADPDWVDPLEGSYAMEHGGRWNRPGSFPVVYLNRTKVVARLNLIRKLNDQPYEPEDLRPDTAPLLVATDVPDAEYVNIVTDEGCIAVGLPKTYPVDDRSEVPHDRCRPIGSSAWDGGEPGIACRSATTAIAPWGEELVWFQRRGQRLEVSRSLPFDDWFWIG